MKEEEKFFHIKEEASDYLSKQQKRGRKILGVSYRETTFIASLFGAWGYIYTFIWDE